MLTGKCKTDFEEWYHKFIVDNLDNKENYRDGFEKETSWKALNLVFFYKDLFVKQQSVYLAFFREKGIEVDKVTTVLDLNNIYTLKISKGCVVYDEINHPDYNTALTEAIKQANQIYNKEKE